MLEEKKIIDKIEILIENDIIQVRERNVILKNGVEIASSFHRFLISKSDETANLDPQIKKIADALWNK